jgi:hypothetical protein
MSVLEGAAAKSHAAGISEKEQPMIQSHPSQSKANTSTQANITSLQHSRLLSQLAALAIAAQAILFASAWLLPLVSEYRLVGDNISELVLGRFGFMQTIAFLIAGLGTLGLAFAIRRFTHRTWGSLTGSLLVALYGLGAILVAIFPTDRIDTAADVFAQSTTGLIHMLVALISFLGMIVGMFILTRTFGLIPEWRPLRRWSVLCAASALAFFIVQGEGPLVGLLQRLMVATISGWMILVALRIRRLTQSSELKKSAWKPGKEIV